MILSSTAWYSVGLLTVFAVDLSGAGSALTFTGIQSLPGGSVALQIWGETERVFEIHTSPDLSAWAWLATLTNATGAMLYTNTGLEGVPVRFYRAPQLP